MKIMKRFTNFIVVLILSIAGNGLTAWSQDLAKADSLPAVKELVIAVASASAADSAGKALAAVHDSNEKSTVKVASPLITKSVVSVQSDLINLHPMAIGFVKGYMTENTERLEKMKGWSVSHFRMIDNILGKYKLPEELKYLAVIESELKSTATSRVGAVGPWQFMPETARILGLKVMKGRDDRKDLYKSTHAAAKYLRDLYAQLGDWLLVIAAYNGGPARVESAIKRSKSRDFWKLQYYLPAESRNHVKKFIATHYIMEGQGGITTVGAKGTIDPEVLQELFLNTDSLIISGKYNSMVLVKTIGMDISVFNQLNPKFDALVSINSYTLHLPADKMALFNANKMQILNESVQFLLTNSANDEKNNFPGEIKMNAVNQQSGVNDKTHRKK
jgi:membrane-bound lytic murein transglycosylase D